MSTTLHVFLFRESNKNLFWLDMAKESFEKQNSLVWQKAWTNPFGKFYFLDVFKSSLILSKNYCFLLRISENDLSLLDFEKKQEAWTNPFGKFRLLGFFRNLALSRLEFNIFYSQYWEIIFSCLICLKNTHEKRLDFFTKTVD